MTPRVPGRLARLVTARLAALRGQLKTLVADVADRASRSVGAAVGEAIRLALRSVVVPTAPIPRPDAFRADPFEVDPFELDRFEEADADDPWSDDPWTEDRAGHAGSTPPPSEFVPESQPQSRGWWGRFASITGSRFTRASMVAGIVAGLVTLLPPGSAAVLGAAAAALIA